VSEKGETQDVRGLQNERTSKQQPTLELGSAKTRQIIADPPKNDDLASEFESSWSYLGCPGTRDVATQTKGLVACRRSKTTRRDSTRVTIITVETSLNYATLRFRHDENGGGTKKDQVVINRSLSKTEIGGSFDRGNEEDPAPL